MASISNDSGGTRRILFVAPDGSRRCVRLGRVPLKTAEAFRVRVEALLAAKLAGSPVDAETARWLGELPDRMRDRLARAGLCEPRARAARITLGELLSGFSRSVDVKPATRVRMKQAESALLQHFGPERDVSTIREADADEWRASLTKAGYAQATVSRTVRYSKQIFRWAMRRGLANTNPFADLKAGPQSNPARQVFVSREPIARVLDAAPDAEWRLLIALSRYGGLRVPSEALALTWHDIDWEHNRMIVRSPKTEHHEGRGERIVPIFPEVREHLQAVFESAPEGAVHVITRYRSGQNLNPHFRRIIRRAGLTPWPRTWHNLRASRQTELAAEYPLHTVCAWIGNTKAIAAGHYLQVTDADWTRATGGAKSGAPAAQNAAQHTAAQSCTELQASPEVPVPVYVAQSGATACAPVQSGPMGRAGLEPATPAFSVRCSTS
jgi:integrase